jgi:hypothetical protein
MSDKFTPASNLPFETYTAARKVYNIHNIYLKIGDHFAEIFTNTNISLLDSTASMKTETVSRLALVTGFQMAEFMPDPLASESCLTRMDWKYALHLPLYHPGLRAASLCAFRQNLYCSPSGLQEYGNVLNKLREFGLFGRFAGPPLQTAEALRTICNINRIYLLTQAMQAALSMVTADAPTWLRTNMRPHWFEHYQAGRIMQTFDPAALNPYVEAQTLGHDIQWLLEAVDQFLSIELSSRPEIEALKHLWQEQYVHTEENITWRSSGCASCAINH